MRISPNSFLVNIPDLIFKLGVCGIETNGAEVPFANRDVCASGKWRTASQFIPDRSNSLDFELLYEFHSIFLVMMNQPNKETSI